MFSVEQALFGMRASPLPERAECCHYRYVCGNAGLCGDLPLGVAPDSSPFYDVCPFGAISGTMLELPCADFETLRTQTLQQMSDYVSTGMVWAKSFERMVRNMVDFVMKVIKV